jgi:hypothetical protein
MWEDLTMGLSVLGFTTAIAVLLIELAAVFNLPPIAPRRAVPCTPAAAPSRRHGGGQPQHVVRAHASAAGRWRPGR